MDEVGGGLRNLLVVATGLLGLTAVPGGAMLLLGVYSPPVEMLAGSVFQDFAIPGVALAVAVGGTALVAVVLLLRRSRYGLVSAGLAGVSVMVFEFVQVLSIGSPPGPSRAMQLAYFALGVLLVTGALTGLAAGRRAPSGGDARRAVAS